MSILRNRLVFALYLWQEHDYISFGFVLFFNLCLFNRGSLNTGSVFFNYFLYVLGSWDCMKAVTMASKGCVCVCVYAGGNGHSPGLGSVGQLLEVGDESLLMQAVSQQLTVAINHYCVVQNSVVFFSSPQLPLVFSISPFPSTAELEVGGQVIRVLHQQRRVGDGQPFASNPFYGLLPSSGVGNNILADGSGEVCGECCFLFLLL